MQENQKEDTKKYKISVVGAGHVGLVAAACFAELGHAVICVDSDKKKTEALKKLILPFYEPDLDNYCYFFMFSPYIIREGTSTTVLTHITIEDGLLTFHSKHGLFMKSGLHEIPPEDPSFTLLRMSRAEIDKHPIGGYRIIYPDFTYEFD